MLPGSGKPGTVVKARPVGYNLEGAEPITTDLESAAPGRVNVWAKTSLGLSNEVPFEVTDLPQMVESEPNDRADEANVVQLPVEISARPIGPATKIYTDSGSRTSSR